MPETTLLSRYLGSANLKANSSDRTLNFSFSSTRPVERCAFLEENLPQGASVIFDEILSHDARAWNLERVDSGVCPFLQNHDRSAKLGQVLKVYFKDDKAYAHVKLRQTTEATQLLIDLEDGLGNGVSFGYRVGVYKVISPAQYDQSGKLIKKALMEGRDIVLFEISSEALPADPTVGFERTEENLISLRTVQIQGDPQWQDVKKISKKELLIIRVRENYETPWRQKENAQKSTLSIQQRYENAWKKR